MANIWLSGHQDSYPVCDILRLFYGQANVNQTGSQIQVSSGQAALPPYLVSRLEQVALPQQHPRIYIRAEVYQEARAAEQAAAGNQAVSASKDTARSDAGQSETELQPVPVIACQAELAANTRPQLLRREIKRQLYMALSQYSGRTYPWGSLTGIKPTYIARELLAESVTAGESGSLQSPESGLEQPSATTAAARLAISRLEQEYSVAPGKAQLAVETALREDQLLDQFDNEAAALYIHIPFCPSRCFYCSFSSEEGIDSPEPLMRSYVRALISELTLTAAAWTEAVRLDSGGAHSAFPRQVRAIYFGGGTPSALPPVLLEELLSALEALPFPWAGQVERTFEAGRPDTLTPAKLEILQAHHYDHISVNPQTMKDETLQKIGRRHTAAQVRAAIDLCHSLGFEHINMDLIAGLPGESELDFERSLSACLELRPFGVSVHALAVKRSSRWQSELDQKQAMARNLALLHQPSHPVAAMLDLAWQRLEAAGLLPYYLYRQKDGLGGLENVSYAREGRGSLYNVAMMTDSRSVLGFGAAAMSKRVNQNQVERKPNVRSLQAYLQRTSEMAQRKIALFSAAD
ncbi:coproporphyrinogen dehydrogenase HemZ [Oscillospiraceae bacterium HV4-5-C5C]|nr:coproporphyrinogen dehydrogenase HemZ [Oscillospiraceae bacterium HV4-5-C5C]